MSAYFIGNLRYAAEAFQSIGVITTFEAINTFDMPRFQDQQIEEEQLLIIHEEMPADELYRHELHSALLKISLMQFSGGGFLCLQLGESKDEKVVRHSSNTKHEDANHP